FDPNRGKMVLGGLYGPKELDAAGWSTPTVTDPEGDAYYGTEGADVSDPNRHRALAYSATERRVLGFGTYTDPTLWGWDGTSWLNINSSPEDDLSNHPPYNSQSYVPDYTYDPVHKRLVVMNGNDSTGFAANGNTYWTWNGHTWSDDNYYYVWDANHTIGTATPPSAMPPLRAGAGFAYDANRQTLWMYGSTSPGNVSDFWRWDLDTGWTFMGSGGASAPNGPGALVYDANRRVTVMLGATQMWEWNTTTWTRRCDNIVEICANRPATYYSTGVYSTYDPNLKAVVVASSGGGTYSWNGAAWTQLAGFTPTSNGLSYSSDTGLVVGTATGSPTSLSLFDNLGWSSGLLVDAYGSGAPSQVSVRGLTYMPSRRAFFLHDNGRELDLGQDQRPAHVMRVDLQALGLQTGEAATYSGLAVTWWATGAGRVGATTTNGVTLMAFDPRGWQARAAGATSPMSWSTSVAGDIARMVMEGRYVYVKAAPTAPGGGKAGSIVTDGVEVRLNYTVTP
ncbi:MAG TPA: hypothetical protein VFH51_07490, partial [Myxococcota bacterium]|nr:hypothetical protein [Myxococcota bacterium]